MATVRTRPGFTMIELLIVLVILGILSAMVIVRNVRTINNAAEAALARTVTSYDNELRSLAALGMTETTASSPRDEGYHGELVDPTGLDTGANSDLDTAGLTLDWWSDNYRGTSIIPTGESYPDPSGTATVACIGFVRDTAMILMVPSTDPGTPADTYKYTLAETDADTFPTNDVTGATITCTGPQTGGGGGGAALNDTWALSAATAPANLGHSAGVASGSIYTSAHGSSAGLSRYDAANETWTTWSPTDNTPNGKLWVRNDVIWRGPSTYEYAYWYDGGADAWRRTNLATGTSHNAEAATVIGDHYYYLGQGTSNPMVRYDPTSNAVTTLAGPAGPPYVWSAGAVEVDGKLLLFGGRDDTFGGDPSDVVSEYDPVSATWDQTRTAMPYPADRVTAVAVGTLVYVFGGTGTSGVELDRYAVYDASADTWTDLGTMPRTRANANAVYLDGQIHIFGGSVNATIHDIYG